MRARLIKPGYFKNDALAALPMAARILFSGLWCLADRAGRLEDRPLRIKAEVLPYDNVDVDALLSDLHQAGFILRYTDGAHQFIQVEGFGRHQTPHVREPESFIPPPYKHKTSTVQASDEHESSPAVPTYPVPTIPETEAETVEREIASPPREAEPAASGADAPLLPLLADGDVTAAEPEPAPTKPPRASPRYTADFLAFWEPYPAGHKDDKQGTFAEYQKQKPDPAVVAAGLQRWLKSKRWKTDGMICDAKKFVKEARWHAHPEVATQEAASNGHASNGGRHGGSGVVTPIAPPSYFAERRAALRAEQELLRDQAGGVPSVP